MKAPKTRDGLMPGDLVELKGDSYRHRMVVSRLGRSDFEGNQVEVAYFTNEAEAASGVLTTKWIGAAALELVKAAGN